MTAAAVEIHQHFQPGLSREEAEQLRAELASSKRLVRLLMGQARATVQALTGLDRLLDERAARLNPRAEEAEDGTEDEERAR